ncbi:MAG TPA: hypothetical protein VK524_02675 [Polyangiaceae bacterium]|nr:hypothetical protein [Polyangiaceae bacterium]
MLKHKPLVMGSVVIALVGSLAPLACGPPPPPPGTGGAAGVGGTPSVPSAPTNCSTDSQGGGGMGGNTTQNCPDTPASPLPLDSFPSCGTSTCTAAHCIPTALIPPTINQALLGRCSDGSTVCVPDDLSTRLGKFRLKDCTSLLGAEGRCVSTCIPQVNGLMDVLPRATCGDNERCAPCFNPNDGTATGACGLGCDPGPSAQTTSNPIVFKKCQNGLGVCAPSSVIPLVLQTQLLPDVCSTGELCAPAQKTQSLKYNFPSCQPSNPLVAILAGIGPNGQTGGCVPAFLADNNPFEGGFMLQDTCLTGEKCAPCNNPLRGLVPTGACPVPLCSAPNGGNPPATR